MNLMEESPIFCEECLETPCKCEKKEETNGNVETFEIRTGETTGGVAPFAPGESEAITKSKLHLKHKGGNQAERIAEFI